MKNEEVVIPLDMTNDLQEIAIEYFKDIVKE
jgi:hypothetical protein